MLERLTALFRFSGQLNSRKIYLLSLVTGLLTGAVAILFHGAIEGLHHLLFTKPTGFSVEEGPSIFETIYDLDTAPFHLLVVLVPTIGGLLAGLCIRYWGEEAQGSGIDHLLENFHERSGEVRKRTAAVKFIASLCTIASGGSVGKEGPMALIGAGIGSLYSTMIKMGARARQTLFLAGAAGGLGAIFRAPLGGAITAVEVLYKEDFEADALLPCIISSVTAYTLFSSFVGFGHALNFEALLFSSPLELGFFALLGLLCSAAGYLFVKTFTFFRWFFTERFKIGLVVGPMIGGLMIGVIGLMMPQAIGEGLGVIQLVLDHHTDQNWLLATGFLLGLALLKMITTSITIQSGGSGGLLVPSLFIGGMIGGAFGTVGHHFFPELIPSVGPYIIVGMAAFFAAVTNASLGALVMVTELTGSYELLPPLMVVAVIALMTSHRWSIYQKQVKNKFHSMAHKWDIAESIKEKESNP